MRSVRAHNVRIRSTAGPTRRKRIVTVLRSFFSFSLMLQMFRRVIQ
jgi:hypothetical protein